MFNKGIAKCGKLAIEKTKEITHLVEHSVLSSGRYQRICVVLCTGILIMLLKCVSLCNYL